MKSEQIQIVQVDVKKSSNRCLMFHLTKLKIIIDNNFDKLFKL